MLSAERVGLACREVRERHLVAAPDSGVHVVNFAGEAVRRKPLRHCDGVEESAVHALGRGAEHAMKADRIRCHGLFLLMLITISASRLATCRIDIPNGHSMGLPDRAMSTGAGPF